MTQHTNFQSYVSIDLTKSCTNNCIFCVVSGTRSVTQDQKFEDIQKFLIDSRKTGETKVNLHGGEPSLYYKFDELIDLINDLGFDDITIQTNGWRLQEQAYIASLIKKNVKLFVVSFHDCDKENHNLLTKNEKSFDEVVNGIKNVIALGGKIRTNTVLVNSNFKRIHNMIDFLYALNVRVFNISSLNPWWLWVMGKRKLYTHLSPDYLSMADYLKETLDAYQDKDVIITLEGFPNCILQGYDKFNLYNWKREISMLSENNVILNYEEYATKDLRLKSTGCEKCKHNFTCGGVWRGYVEYKGWDEFQPVLC
jgi:MoaA/NifB/PqqE/SkfB family radical SAM enzyme